MKKILFVLACLITFPVYSQNVQAFVQNVASRKFRNSELSEIQGNPFYNKEFTSGTIKLSDSTIFNNILMRYNIFEEIVEISSKLGEIAVLSPEKIAYLILDGKKIKHLTLPGKNLSGYYIVLAEGKNQLLQKKRVIYLMKEGPAPMTNEIKPPRFEQKSDIYYLQEVNNEIVQIKNKKQLIKLFPEKGKTIEEFVKANETDFDKSEDLIKLFQLVLNTK